MVHCPPLLAIDWEAFSESVIDSGSIPPSVLPSVIKGLLLSSSTIASRYSLGKMFGSAFFGTVTFGRYCCSRLFAFSLVPHCRGEYGSQKQAPASSAIPEPWSYVSEFRMSLRSVAIFLMMTPCALPDSWSSGWCNRMTFPLDLSASALIVFLLAVPAMKSTFQWSGMARSSISGGLSLLDLVAASLPTL